MRRVAHGVVDFVIGDDVRIAIAVALLLGAAAVLEETGIDAWWVLPLGVPAALWISLTRVRRSLR